MKRGVTYLNHSEYRRYRLVRDLVRFMRVAAVWMAYCLIVGVCLWIFAALFVRGLDIEYNMQQAKIERYLAVNGDNHDK